MLQIGNQVVLNNLNLKLGCLEVNDGLDEKLLGIFLRASLLFDAEDKVLKDDLEKLLCLIVREKSLKVVYNIC